jgi:hypothetical protein
MRWSLLVWALAWVLLVPVPALSQPSQDDPSGAQYDQYGGPGPGVGGPGVGGQAVHDAIVASGAIRAAAEGPQASTEGAQASTEGPQASTKEAQAGDEGAVSAAERPHATGGPDLASAGEAVSEDPAGTAEAQDESSPDLEKLPNTGGPSPLWLGVPLLCAGGLLARRILL